MFYTIDGVDDDQFPPEHPETIKFYDRASAEKFLSMLHGFGIFKQCSVKEHVA